MNVKSQMSETVRIGVMLSVAAGLMDAYCYVTRNHVFANAQTGNMILFGINIASGYMGNAWKYFFPVVIFIVGILLTELVRHKLKEDHILHWRQWSVLVEAALLTMVIFIPDHLDMFATCTMAFVSGIQVESFRKIHGNAIATTICMGNMRTGSQNLAEFFLKKEKKFLFRAFLYFGMIGCMIGGSAVGALFLPYFGNYTLFISVGILIVAFFMLFIANTKSTRLLEHGTRK